MRIARLELRRFGHFEDAELDFTSGAGLQVVFGPNEAGKTTTLDAIRYTLHGMPQGRSNEPKYDFRFRTNQIRTALELVLDSGETLAFARSRSTKASVLDPVTDAPDEQLDALLARTLAGVPRTVWDTKHGLDQDAMRRGARALLENAATDESLFAAATGTASVHRVLDELRAARRALLSDAGSAGELHQAVKELKEATSELGRARRAAAGYDEIVAELQTLDTRVDELNAARRRAEQQRDELERALGAAPRLAERRVLTEQLEAAAALPASWTREEHEQLVATLQQLRELDAGLATLDETRRQLRERLEALRIDETLVAAAETLDQLHQRLAVVRDASARLPELQVDARRTREAMRAALEAVRPGCGDGVDARTALPPAAARTQLAQAVEQLAALEQELADARHALELATEARDAAAAAAARDAGTSIDVDALDAAIEVAARIDCAAIERDAARLEAERTALEQRARRIPGASLDVDGACCVGVPGERERVELETAFAALEQREDDARTRLQQAEVHAAEYRAQLAELQAAEVPERSRLEQLRGERAEAFEPLRRSLLGQAPLDDAPATLAVYDARVAAADQHADLLVTDGERVGRVRELEQRIAADDERAAAARADLEAVAAERAALLERWASLWQPTGIAAASVTTMRAVLDELGAIRDAADELRVREAELQARRAAVDTARADLHAALGGSAAAGESLDAALQRARTTRRQLEQAREGAARATGELEAAERALAAATRRVEAAQAARDGFDASWQAALAATELPATTTAAAARAQLAALAQLQQAIDAHAAAAGSESDAALLVERFAEDVRALVETLGEEAAAVDVDAPAVVVEQLRARVDAARSDLRVRDEAREHLRRLDADAEQRQAQRSGAAATLEALRTRAGASDQAALEALDACWVAREQLRVQLAALDQELVAATQMPVDALAALLGERDESELRVLLDDAREQVAALAEQHAAAKARRDELQKQVGALEEGSSQAEASARIRDARARLEQLVPEYRQLALQERMLQTMLDEHARRDMGPVVERTGRYLETLTCGAWTRMVIGIADDGTPQVQLERGGDPDALVALDGLSEGTVDQLYLALRLAMLVEGAGRGESMPFVLDDVLPSFDDERAEATFRLLAEVSEHFQVIFLTHHAHLARIAEAALEPGQVTLHQLPRFGTPAPAVAT